MSKVSRQTGTSSGDLSLLITVKAHESDGHVAIHIDN
jgi:hypothetical protein